MLVNSSRLGKLTTGTCLPQKVGRQVLHYRRSAPYSVLLPGWSNAQAFSNPCHFSNSTPTLRLSLPNLTLY